MQGLYLAPAKRALCVRDRSGTTPQARLCRARCDVAHSPTLRPLSAVRRGEQGHAQMARKLKIYALKQANISEMYFSIS